MEKKNIDWGNLSFGYVQTDYRYVSNYKDGAWDEGGLTTDANIVINECAGVLQYAQTCFEGMKAYTTEDGKIVCFRPDLNASRMAQSCERLKMPVFPEDKFVEAVIEVVRANAAWVPPFGSGASLYLRPYMFGSNPVIGVKPATEYQFRIFATPVGPYCGYGFYGAKFTIPADWAAREVNFLFHAVDEQAWVYVNGKLVGEHSEKSEKVDYGVLWNEPFIVKVKPEDIRPGKDNVIVVKIHNIKGACGIWKKIQIRPVDASAYL
jgi:hypothetical protein